MLYRRVISQLQFELLLETRILERMSLRDWARARGLPEGTVQSLAFRAERAIRAYQKAQRRGEDPSVHPGPA